MIFYVNKQFCYSFSYKLCHKYYLKAFDYFYYKNLKIFYSTISYREGINTFYLLSADLLSYFVKFFQLCKHFLCKTKTKGIAAVGCGLNNVMFANSPLYKPSYFSL